MFVKLQKKKMFLIFFYSERLNFCECFITIEIEEVMHRFSYNHEVEILNKNRNINILIIGHCNSSVRIMAQLLTAHMLCALILYVRGITYSLMSIAYNRFLRNFSWQFYFYTQSFCQKSAERKSPKKYFFIFRFGA